MTSYLRHNANLRNARKSTGPRTPKGKAAVRLNSLSHGAFAADLLLPGEDAEAFHQLEAGFLKRFHPSTAEEIFWVKRLVLAAWRLDRLAAMESRVLRSHATHAGDDARLFRAIRNHLEHYGDPHADEFQPPIPLPDDQIANAWIRDGNGSNSLAKLARYQTALERSFHRALRELRGENSSRKAPLP